MSDEYTGGSFLNVPPDQVKRAADLLQSRRANKRGGRNGGRPPYCYRCPACRTKLTERAFADAGRRCPVCTNVGVVPIKRPTQPSLKGTA